MSDAQPADVAPGFEIDALVRIKAGVRDPDEPRLPLGGWIGTVVDFYDDGGAERMCLVHWSDETLAGAHPIYEFLAEREGLDSHEVWLDERDLELSHDPAGPLEPPPEDYIREVHDRDARLRAVLGLADDEDFPLEEDGEQLRKWHTHLAGRLPLPCEARMYDEDEDRDRDVTVVRLIEPEGDDDFSTGLWCDCREENRPLELPLSELEVKNDQAADDLVRDYTYWYYRWCHIEQNDEGWDDPSWNDEGLDEDFGPEDDSYRRVWLQARALSQALESGASLVPPELFDDAAPLDNDETVAPAPLLRPSDKVGRNDPCPCGSGLKFKKCCLKRSG